MKAKKLQEDEKSDTVDLEQGRFSERMGFVKVSDTIQLEGMDTNLKNSIWNVFHELYSSGFEASVLTDIHRRADSMFKLIWKDFFKYSLFDVPKRPLKGQFEELHNTYNAFPWYKAYDFVEFLVSNPGYNSSYKLTETFNSIFEREFSGYRLVAGKVIAIIDTSQLGEIQKAIDDSVSPTLKGVHIHLKAALEMISLKPQGDYRNSIKETISALESLLRVIANKPQANFGTAFSVVDKVLNIEPALKSGFSSLYGYTNNNGSRHALTDASDVNQEEAIYFLVSCSAFINYIITKAIKAEIFK